VASGSETAPDKNSNWGDWFNHRSSSSTSITAQRKMLSLTLVVPCEGTPEISTHASSNSTRVSPNRRIDFLLFTVSALSWLSSVKTALCVRRVLRATHYTVPYCCTTGRGPRCAEEPNSDFPSAHTTYSVCCTHRFPTTVFICPLSWLSSVKTALCVRRVLRATPIPYCCTTGRGPRRAEEPTTAIYSIPQNEISFPAKFWLAR